MYDEMPPLPYKHPGYQYRMPPLPYKLPQSSRKPTASTPKPKPHSSGRSVRSRAKQQPRDWHGRFASIGRGLKKSKKTVKNVRRNLSPKYHLQRMQRTRRANKRAELRRQGYSIPKRRPQRRRPVKHMPR
jgi:hypothetical protein